MVVHEMMLLIQVQCRWTVQAIQELTWSDRSLAQPDEQEAAGGVGEWSEVCFRNAAVQLCTYDVGIQKPGNSSEGNPCDWSAGFR